MKKIKETTNSYFITKRIIKLMINTTQKKKKEVPKFTLNKRFKKITNKRDLKFELELFTFTREAVKNVGSDSNHSDPGTEHGHVGP